MRNRILPLLAALALVLAACGGDDTPRGNTLDDDDDPTTTTADAGEDEEDEPTGTTADEPISTRPILARLVLQVDDAYRTAYADARPCIVGPEDQCTVPARDAYNTLDDLAGALRFVLDGATNPESSIYSGRAADDAVAMIDESLAISDRAKAAAAEAQAACGPPATDECDAATDELTAAADELLKNMNAWRDVAS